MVTPQVFMTLFKVLAGMYVLSTGNLLLMGLAFFFYRRQTAPEVPAAVQQAQVKGPSPAVEAGAPERT